MARRRDQLTYDLGPSSARRPLPLAPVAVLVVVLGLAVVLVVGLVRSGGGDGPVTAAAPAEPSAPVPAPPTPSASPTPAAPAAPSVGTDAGEGLAAPEGSQETTTRFVRAWLDPEPTTRAAALEQLAVPALAEQLMLTDPANVPQATPAGPPVLTDASTYSAQFTQALSTGTKITVYLVADPQARYRWLTSSVEQA